MELHGMILAKFCNILITYIYIYICIFLFANLITYTFLVLIIPLEFVVLQAGIVKKEDIKIHGF